MSDLCDKAQELVAAAHAEEAAQQRKETELADSIGAARAQREALEAQIAAERAALAELQDEHNRRASELKRGMAEVKALRQSLDRAEESPRF